MAGAFYIWIMGAFFIGAVGVMTLLGGIFLIGHWLEKKDGATHGFLEAPRGSGGKLVGGAGMGAKNEEDSPSEPTR